AAMLGGPASAGTLKFTTIGVPCTSTCPGNGSFAGATLNSHLTLGEKMPAAMTVMHSSSCGGLARSHGTQPVSGSQDVSFQPSLSVVHGVSGRQVPCEQISSGMQGTSHTTEPPPAPVNPPPEPPCPPPAPLVASVPPPFVSLPHEQPWACAPAASRR